MPLKRMDDRKEKILRAATDEYISSAEPVGSRTIARKYDLGLSPATIRNEMSDLEEGGYLQQPHTSAGRIPSVRGYRYYVDALMEQRPLTTEEEEQVRRDLDVRRREIDSLLNQTSRILSQMTNFPSMVLGPDLETAVFRHVQLLPLDESNVVVVVVTNSGRVAHHILDVTSSFSDGDLKHISAVLNNHLTGKTFGDLRSTLLSQIRSEVMAHDRFFEEVLRLLTNALRPSREERLRVDGTVSIMEHPEFREVEKLKPLLALLSGDRMLEMLSGTLSRGGVNVRIGDENELPDMRECSVVTSTYEVAGHPMGVIGVLGPTRMEYNRVVAVVEYVAACLSELISRMADR